MAETSAPRDDLKLIDLAAVIEGIRAGTAPNAWMARWLPKTYAAPDAFRKLLYKQGAARRGGLESSRDGVIDLYNDCVIAHLGQQKRAIVQRDGERESQLSYEGLHSLSGALMSAWRAAGMEAGQSVCVVLPVGVDYVVALVTALRMGLVVTTLPPHGPTFARNRVEALAPMGVVMADRHRPWLAGLKVTFLPVSGSRGVGDQGSHAYAPGDPALCLFNAFGQDPLTPVEVPAGLLHATLLRDALFVFALGPKDTLAMPGQEPLASQPTSLLTALMGGVSWAEVSVRDLYTKPSLLSDLGVTLLGVGRPARDALLAAGKWPPGSIRAWFRTMTDTLDLDRWDELGRLSAKAGAASFNATLCPVAGGALLFGPVAKEPPGLHVWPPPGQAWQLGEVGAGVMESLNETGVYTPLVDEAPIEGVPPLLVARSGDGYQCTGSLDLGPDARPYPVLEVSAVAERHPEVRHATVVVSQGRSINEANVTLIAFVDDSRGPDGKVAARVSAEELVKLVTREMGEAFAPSRVEVFPLRPRFTEEGVDHGWCRSQYLGGAFSEKARRELFVLVSRLGYMLDPRPKSGEAKEGR